MAVAAWPQQHAAAASAAAASADRTTEILDPFEARSIFEFVVCGRTSHRVADRRVTLRYHRLHDFSDKAKTSKARHRSKDEVAREECDGHPPRARGAFRCFAVERVYARPRRVAVVKLGILMSISRVRHVDSSLHCSTAGGLALHGSNSGKPKDRAANNCRTFNEVNSCSSPYYCIRPPPFLRRQTGPRDRARMHPARAIVRRVNTGGGVGGRGR
jgi:hypothetical protein